MKIIKNILNKILETCVVASICGMIVVVAIQIVARFALPKAPYWTEEAARIFFIFMVSFATGLAVKDKALVNVDTFLSLLPCKIRKIVKICTYLLTATLMAIMLIKSITFIKIGSMQRSPSLGIPMSYVFVSMFILSLFVCVYSLIIAWDIIKENKADGIHK